MAKIARGSDVRQAVQMYHTTHQTNLFRLLIQLIWSVHGQEIPVGFSYRSITKSYLDGCFNGNSPGGCIEFTISLKTNTKDHTKNSMTFR